LNWLGLKNHTVPRKTIFINIAGILVIIGIIPVLMEMVFMIIGTTGIDTGGVLVNTGIIPMLMETTAINTGTTGIIIGRVLVVMEMVFITTGTTAIHTGMIFITMEMILVVTKTISRDIPATAESTKPVKTPTKRKNWLKTIKPSLGPGVPAIRAG
jgi:hypothetical protein